MELLVCCVSELTLLSYGHEILYPVAQRHFHTLRPRLGNCHFILTGNYWFSQLLGGLLPFLQGGAWRKLPWAFWKENRPSDMVPFLCLHFAVLWVKWKTLGSICYSLFCEVLPPQSQSYLFHISAFNGQSFLTSEFLFSKLFWLLMVPAPKEYQTWKVGYNAAPKLTPFICGNKMLKERW